MKKVKVGIHKVHNNKIWRYILPKWLNSVTYELNKTEYPDHQPVKIYKWLWFYIAISD
jgi:hypothetical protein